MYIEKYNPNNIELWNYDYHQNMLYQPYTTHGQPFN